MAWRSKPIDRLTKLQPAALRQALATAPENVSIERAPQPSMAAPLSGCRPIVYFRHPCP
ncbi:hypothetical protein IE4803_CH02695 [Rhizobium etli bv. phaseoli str. IE4803]|nr:hypothetical protein IE4803_CH02695 [Rhizobium etli bv. phaseoli str. IE4803]ARQ58771.1 hypothetical protein Kim5_CH02727 [Rhizobium sp. Kim5]